MPWTVRYTIKVVNKPETIRLTRWCVLKWRHRKVRIDLLLSILNLVVEHDHHHYTPRTLFPPDSVIPRSVNGGLGKLLMNERPDGKVRVF